EIVSLSKLRIEANRLAVAGSCSNKIPLGPQHMSQVRMRCCVLRVESDGLSERRTRPVQVLFAMQGKSEFAVRGREPWGKADGLAVLGNGPVQVIASEQG